MPDRVYLVTSINRRIMYKAWSVEVIVSRGECGCGGRYCILVRD